MLDLNNTRLKNNKIRNGLVEWIEFLSTILGYTLIKVK